MDLVFYGAVGGEGQVVRVVPAGVHTGDFAAQHIGGQTVAQHQALVALYARQAGKASVEKAQLGLIGT